MTLTRLLCSFVWASTLFVLPLSATASTWSVFGFDSRTLARSGGVVADVQGPASLFYNPAGLIRGRGMQTTMSYIHGEPLLRYNQQTNPDLLSVGSFSPLDPDSVCSGEPEDCAQQITRYNSYIERAAALRSAIENLQKQQRDAAMHPRRVDGITLGASMALTETPVAHTELLFPVAGGIALYLPVAGPLYIRTKGPSTPFFLRYDDMPQHLIVNLGVAAEPLPGLRLGVGLDVFVDISASLNGQILLPPEITLGLPPSPDLQNINVALDGALTTPWSLAPVAGLQYQPLDWLELGVAFRDEQRAQVDIDGTLSLPATPGAGSVPVKVSIGGIFNPRQLAGGAALHLQTGKGMLHVETDLVWRQWSRYLPPFAITANLKNLGQAICSALPGIEDLYQLLEIAKEVGFALTRDELCALISRLVAADSGTVNGQDINNITVDLYDTNEVRNAFTDTLNPGLALSWAYRDWEISGGYRWEPSPVPLQDGIFNILDGDTHLFSGGIERRLANYGVTLAFATQYRFLQSLTVSKDSTRVQEYTGSSDSYPDFSVPLDHLETARLEEFVSGVQTVTPGYPGYSSGGGYLTVSVQISAEF